MSKIKTAISLCKSPLKMIKPLSQNGLLGWMPDKLLIELMYKASFGKKPDLENPKTFNEKLQWLKLYNRRPEYTMMADKYAVRKYIAETIGEQYLIPLLGEWDSVEDIDFEALPNKFVLKCNHDQGSVIICRDKTKFDVEAAKKKLKYKLGKDHYEPLREWPYKNIPHKVIAEQYMSDSLCDYSVFSLDRATHVTLAYSVAFTESDNIKEYFCSKNIGCFKAGLSEAIDFPEQKRKQYALMRKLAEKLAEKTPVDRIDFYETDGDIYFAEIAFRQKIDPKELKPDEWGLESGKWLEYSDNRGYRLYTDDCSIIIPNPYCAAAQGTALTDYKFFCFNGVAESVMVCTERETGHPKFYFFDKSWNLKKYNILGKKAPEGFTFPKPDCINEMFDIAEKLSKGIPFVRVDLYCINGQIYFGETTFFPDSGFDANLLKESDEHWGKMLALPEKRG